MGSRDIKHIQREKGRERERERERGQIPPNMGTIKPASQSLITYYLLCVCVTVGEGDVCTCMHFTVLKVQ